MTTLRGLLRRPGWGHLPELVVLAVVLAIAALASYIHLREVWEHAGAPVPAIGPLTVDGLFAAAWLRMRRRRRQGEPVGVLAWLALGLALVATVAGNLAAAWIAGHRDPLSLVVAAWPALAFAVVWELATGHGRRVETGGEPVEEPLRPPAFVPLAVVAASTRPPLSAQVTTPGGGVAPVVETERADREETPEQRLDRLIAEGAGRKRVARELAITEWEARDLLAKRRGRVETVEEESA